MGLIVNAPLGTTSPSAADLRTCFRKIVEQLGGVYEDENGVLQSYPGNLEQVNFTVAVSAGFRLDQRAIPANMFALCAAAEWAPPAQSMHVIVPVDCRLKMVARSFYKIGGNFKVEDERGRILVDHDADEVVYDPDREEVTRLDALLVAGTVLKATVTSDFTTVNLKRVAVYYYVQMEHVP